MSKSDIQSGDAVIIISKCNRTNEIGVASDLINGRWRVQFGASGPFSCFNPESIRHATLNEVKKAGKYGIGCRIIDDL